MMIRRAFRFRLEPNDEQRRKLAQFAGARRWVWNQALEKNMRCLETGKRTASYAEMCRWITSWRHSEATSWLADIHVHTLQQGVKDLARALADYFRKAGDAAKKAFPRFKRKGDGDGFRYPMSVKVGIVNNGWGRVWLPKIGWVHYRASRNVEGEVAQATIVSDGDHWFISIQTELKLAEPACSGKPSVGLDLGVVQFLTLSDGTMIEPINAFGRARRRIARAQRKLARKQKGSNNRTKQRRQLAKLRRKERNLRQDFLHKTSTSIAKRYGTVVMEDLPVRQMTASPPGRIRKSKSRLNCSILDQGWHQFKVLLRYKLLDQGAELVLVDPTYTSQRCAGCGHTEPANRKNQAVFDCKACGHHEHADLNAARNILAAGHAVKACGGKGLKPPYEAGTHREAG